MRPGVLALLFVVLAAPPVRAQQPPPRRLGLHLEYSRGPRTICPDEHAVAEILRGSVDYEARDDAEVRAVVTTSRVGRQQRVRVVLRDRTDRELWWGEHEDPDCMEAVLSCAVSTALALTNLGLGLPDPAPVAVAPAPPVAAPVCVAPPAPVVLPPPAAPVVAAPSPFELFGGLDLLFGVGSTPSPSFGAGLFMGLRFPRLRLAVQVTVRASATASASPPGYVALSTTSYSGQLAVCWHRQFVFLCPLVGVGKRDSDGISLVIAPAPPFPIVGASVGAQHRVGQFLMHGFLELDVLPGAPPIDIPGGDRWRSAFGGVVGVGFAL